MTNAVRARLNESFGAFRGVFANPNLRRLELAWAGTQLGRWAYFVALAVYAFDQGGASAVALMAVVRLIPSAFAAPFTSILGDRYPRKRVMFVTNLVQATTLSIAAALIFVDGPAWGVYAIVGLNAMIVTAFRPAQAALLPSLAREPAELTAANVVSTTIESLGMFVGPAIGGVILAFSNTSTVFVFMAAAALWSAALVARIQAPPAEPRERPHESKLRAAFAGFGTIFGTPPLRVLEFLAAGQTLVAGAFNVLIVVTALQLLDVGAGGLGAFNSAVGIGGLLGAVVAALLVSREGIVRHFALGMLLWGIPIALIGLFPNSTLALVFLVFIGIGNTLVDVAALTLLQRVVPDEVLARVFGAVSSLSVLTLGLGALLAPLLIDQIGIRASLIVTGALLPVLTVLLFRQLTALDTGAITPSVELDLLGSNPIFAPLPQPTLETLGAKLVPVRQTAGKMIFHQGDHGDRYYLVAGGRVDVSIDGQPTRTLEAGDGFGEIALLRDVPRTATVTAVTDVSLYALERDDFIGAVTGHGDSTDRAEAVIASRVGTLRASEFESV